MDNVSDLVYVGVKLLNQKKEKVIANILSLEKVFSEPELKSMTLEQLEKLNQSLTINKFVENEIPEAPAVIMTNFNPYHGKDGKFASKGSGGAAGGDVGKGTPASGALEGKGSILSGDKIGKMSDGELSEALKNVKKGSATYTAIESEIKRRKGI
ncbi:MAG: hypothetical protein GX864_03815 [Mollicutes bacterium]|jgi:hypothetical protein|nr:hypothetical protein [Mollicutes bacterium]